MSRPRRAQGPHVKAANQYARDVVAGKICACGWVVGACRRHLHDLERARTAVFPYRFDAQKADRAMRFVELLPHTKGKWALGKAGKPGTNLIRLEPWQKWVIASLFGWVRKGSGLRRFRQAYIAVPRKNGKSAIAAGVGLYMLAADGEVGAEVYAGATTEKQAWEVFRPARMMAEKTPGLRRTFGVEVNARTLHVGLTASRFEPVIGKPGDGASPSCAIVDEYHEHRSDELYDTMLTGMGAREQPLMLVITTAGHDLAGPCYALQEDVQQILAGTLVDDEIFGAIWTIDEGDDWTSEIALRKANPNYGVSIGGDYLRARQQEAQRSARKQNTFRTKHLNVWVGARSAWMNMELWKRAGDASLSPEEFAGDPCWVGLDLSSKIDITAEVKVFRRMVDGAEHYYAFGRYYLPEATAEDPEKRHYQGWAERGHLITTDGSVIDYGVLRADIVEDAEDHQLRELAFDPWGATQLASELAEEHNIVTVEVPQRVSHLSEPMKHLEMLVIAGRFHHDDNPVMNWMMSNVTARTDANDNVFPRKEKPEYKIDGPVALIMALGRAIVNGGEDAGSVYDERGLLVF